MMDNSALASM